jgi:hypothetical protein
MRHLRAFWVKLIGLATSSRRGRELDEELASHLQIHIDDTIRAVCSFDRSSHWPIAISASIAAVCSSRWSTQGAAYPQGTPIRKP